MDLRGRSLASGESAVEANAIALGQVEGEKSKLSLVDKN